MATSAVNLARLLTIRNDIKDAIGNKGVTIPSGTAFDDYPTYISRISGGGGNEPIYGVSGLYQSNPALTRTDDAVGMDFVINSSAGTIDSDFDNVFPWNETSVVYDSSGNKFLIFPRMYFRVGADSSYRLTDIAVSRAPRATGDWYEVPPFMYSCYTGSVSDNKLKSVAGTVAMNAYTRAQYRACATANGTGYHLIDLYHHTVLMFLWFIEFATKKSDSIMTGRIKNSGTQGGSSLQRTGGTDSLTTPSGFETAYGQMRYHYIEDFVGNKQNFVDGICCKSSGSHHYVTDNPAYFSDDTTGKSPLVYTVPLENWITALGWDSNHPFMCMPVETDSEADTAYFTDCMRGMGDDTSPVLICGNEYDATSYYRGLSYYAGRFDGSASAMYGSRLIKTI